MSFGGLRTEGVRGGSMRGGRGSCGFRGGRSKVELVDRRLGRGGESREMREKGRENVREIFF